MVKIFCMQDGLFGQIAVSLGGTAENYLVNPGYFRTIYVVSDIWQKIGWDSIIYLAALSAIDQEQYLSLIHILSAEDWIEEYMKNSAAIREAYRKNEEMLDRHVRCFTRGKERWTRQVADPLISFMFRYISRIQDLGTACELAQSLLEFYEGLGDDVAVMKCLLARAFCCDFLDGIHLEDQVKEDCARASIIYEREFLRLTPEEQSMGLSIYDLEFDRLSNRLKLGDISSALIEEMVEIHRVSQKALDYVVAVDQGYEFNLLLPDFDYYLGFCALCLSPGECTQEQCAAILAAARRRQETSEKETGHAE